MKNFEKKITNTSVLILVLVFLPFDSFTTNNISKFGRDLLPVLRLLTNKSDPINIHFKIFFENQINFSK